MDVGEFKVRNTTGGALSLRGHSLAAGAEVDLLPPGAPADCCFTCYSQANNAWRDVGTWLGALNDSGDLELVSYRQESLPV